MGDFWRITGVKRLYVHVRRHVRVGLNGELRQTEAHVSKSEGDLDMVHGRK